MAYGQTGAGKTFSLNGTPEILGALPTLLQTFDGLAEQTSLEMSVLDIQHERLSDLLSDTPLGTCKLRQTKEEGVYVEGLTKVHIANSEAGLAVLQEAWQRSCVRATTMGQTTSRSTSIVILETTIHDGTEEFSSRHFVVDLVGSERVSKTKEAILERQPLNSLGNIAMSLVDNTVPGRRLHIPYKDSQLTRLLENALGRDAMDRTLILGCLSPAECNAMESLSTLRFLTRFHQIPCTPRQPRRRVEDVVLRFGAAMVKPAASAASRRVVDDPTQEGEADLHEP
mmetsp:Transcript_37767/g.88274  ORF Transcript_37767/g.88274 Transcript_37767/m.88274 type:complete len:284 (+) Transcript_37767:305-1156(+)